MQTKYIFITGGVISTLGKGVTTASIAALLQAKGYRVTCLKCDAYVNIDAGTMNPTEHGEVFVTFDGVEADQDVGNYERFLNRNLSQANYLTTGQVYQRVIEKERNLEYSGKCVEVVPHVPLEIISRMKNAASVDNAEIVISEIGGTVGEYQNVLFLEADRMLKREFPCDVINIHVSYLPIPKTVGEMKTKPVQYSIRTLQSAGIQPEFVVGRSELTIDDKRKEKIALFGNMDKDNIISNPDVESIYQVPLVFEEQKFGEKILQSLNLTVRKRKRADVASLKKWSQLIKTIQTAKSPAKIGVVGKYFDTGEFVLEDSYISVIEAVKHACWSLKRKPEIQWINSKRFEKFPERLKKLKEYNAIIVPGGFGATGVEGKIMAIQYAREHNIPFLGLCYGMQLAVIEFSRNVLGLKGAHTEEVDKKTKHPVIHILHEQKKLLAENKYGASMRLGAYACELKKSSKVYQLYGTTEIYERHRHRFEFNNEYLNQIEAKGLTVVGINNERNLVEIVELKKHPFFVGVQFHPEFQSRPLQPHPLFVGLIQAGGIRSEEGVRP